MRAARRASTTTPSRAAGPPALSRLHTPFPQRPRRSTDVEAISRGRGVPTSRTAGNSSTRLGRHRLAATRPVDLAHHLRHQDVEARAGTVGHGHATVQLRHPVGEFEHGLAHEAGCGVDPHFAAAGQVAGAGPPPLWASPAPRRRRSPGAVVDGALARPGEREAQPVRLASNCCLPGLAPLSVRATAVCSPTRSRVPGRAAQSAG